MTSEKTSDITGKDGLQNLKNTVNDADILTRNILERGENELFHQLHTRVSRTIADAVPAVHFNKRQDLKT